MAGQSQVAEIILQKQIAYEYHLTILAVGNFFYINHPNGHIVLTDYTQVGELPHIEWVREFFILWNKHFKSSGEYMLLEMGLSCNEIYLFQAVKIPEQMVETIFTNDLVAKILVQRDQWKKSRSLWGSLKVEWSAFCFRKSKKFNESGTTALAFKNWYFIFHYFYLFCKLHRRYGHDQDFVDFLAMTANKNWMSDIVKKHIKLATIINKKENFSLPTSFMKISAEPYFIGTGVFQGKVEDFAYLMERPLVEDIYNLDFRQKVIFTRDSNILGHPILAAVERRIPVVANISATQFNDIKVTDSFYLNFKEKKLEVEST